MVNNEIISINIVILSSLIVSIAFFIGALLSIYLKLPNRIKGDIVSFSAGIFLSAVSFSILEESVKLGNIISTAIGFGLGAPTFSIIRYKLQKEDKIENSKDKSKNDSRKNDDSANSSSEGKLIIVGTLADSHPETNYWNYRRFGITRFTTNNYGIIFRKYNSYY